MQSRKVNKLISLLAIDEVVTTDPELTQQYVLDFFSKSFSDQLDSSSTDLGLVRIIPSMVSKKDNLGLFAIPCDVNVEDVVFQLDCFSALGPDGFTRFVFQTCWDRIGMDVVSVVQF